MSNNKFKFDDTDVYVTFYYRLFKIWFVINTDIWCGGSEGTFETCIDIKDDANITEIIVDEEIDNLDLIGIFS